MLRNRYCMKVLFDIGHPKDIHTFKHVYSKLINNGDYAIMICRERQHNIELLEAYNIEYICIGHHYKHLIMKVIGLIKNIFQMLSIAIKVQPDVFVSHNSTLAAVVSKLVNRPHIAIEDTFNTEQTRLSMPFTDVVLTGDYPHPTLGKKEIQYPGYHELAYLHPNYFQPLELAHNILNIVQGEIYVLVRFVSWSATHDIGHRGFTDNNKELLIGQLSKYLRVFVSSEGPLPISLEKYSIDIPAEMIHDVMHFAHFYIGESSTMAAECALMGTPAIYLNDSKLGYIADLESVGLVTSFSETIESQKDAIKLAIDYACSPPKKSSLTQVVNQLTIKKIDVSEFIFWFISNYPSSEQIVRGADFSFDIFTQ